MPKIKWMYHHKDIEKQINMNLLGGTLTMVIMVALSYFENPVARALHAILFFHLAYIFVELAILTKKWVDKAYR
jgi:hypothetical protein